MDNLSEPQPQSKGLRIVEKTIAFVLVAIITCTFFFSLPISLFLMLTPIFGGLALCIYFDKVKVESKRGKIVLLTDDERMYGRGGCHSMAQLRSRRGH